MATLNLQNPSWLYSSGVVDLNPLPYAQMAERARARKEAREQAIDNYYQKLPDTINDKGVRDQEIPVINEYKNKIFEFGLKNKESLRNPKADNGAAQFQLQKLMREAQAVARESQNAAKTDLELGKLWFNKENQWALANDDFIKQHDQHNLPVNDPGYKKMDLANVMSQRPFDQDKFVKQLKTQFPYSEQTSRQSDPTNPLYDIVTTKPVLDKKTKESIYDFAADKLHNDYTFANKIKKDLAGTGQLPRLQEISKEVFGKEIENDEDLAAAYTASQMYRPPTKEKSQTDVGAVMDKRNQFAVEQQARGFRQQEKMAGLRFGYSKALKDYTAGVDAAADETVLNKFIKNTIDNGTPGSATINGVEFKGTISDVPKDISIKYKATVDDPNDPKYSIEKEPDRWLFTEDGKSAIPLYYEGRPDPKTGKAALITNPNQKPVSIQNLKADLSKILLSQKQRGTEVVEQYVEQGSGTTKKRGKYD